MKYIGPKISCKELNKEYSIIIAAEGERWEIALLWIWTALWLGIGGYFASYLFLVEGLERDFKLFVSVFLAFWAFYFFKILGMAMWRTKGYESILFSEDKITMSQFNGFRFKRQSFFVRNIEQFEKLVIKDKSLLNAYYSGFWVKGIDFLSFTHQKKEIRFAKQIDNDSADKLFKLMRKLMSTYK